MRVKQMILGGCLALLLSLTSGCGESKPPLSSFSIDVDRDDSALNVRYTGPGTLQDCNIVLSVKMEDGTVRTINRYWAYWNEAKVVELPKNSKVELVELSGSVVKVTNPEQAELLQCRYVERFK